MGELQEAIDKYHASLNLTSVVPSKVDEILSMSHDVLTSLHPEVCAEYAFTLSQAAFHVQKESNKLAACLSWCNKNIDAMGCKHYDNYGGRYTPFDVRKQMFIRENEAAKQFKQLADRVERRKTALDYLPTRMTTMAEHLTNLARAKHRQGNT